MRWSLVVLILGWMWGPAAAHANDQPVFVDSLVPQRIPVGSFRDLGNQGFDAARDDSLAGLALRIVEGLSEIEGPCRTNLFLKDQEPGSPWLMWRSFRRVEAGGTPWYVGALSCTDVLCRYSASESESPVELSLHDRVALVGIGPRRTCIYLLPPQPATIGDQGTAVVGSVDAVQGKGYTVVQARRDVNWDTPCADGGDHVEFDEHYFMVLRGDSLVQSFMMVPRQNWYSHDDADGDLETNRSATLSVSPTSIRMAYQVEEVQHSVEDGAITGRRITRRGVVELAWDARLGRFRRLR